MNFFRAVTRLLMLALATSNAQAAGIHIVITYHELVTETRPRPGHYTTTQRVTVTLHDQHFASEHREWRSGSQSGVVDSDSAFGTPVQAGAYDLDWHVEGEKNLVRVKSSDQHSEKLQVKVSGNRCTATITEKLKPGFSEFLRYGSQNDAHFMSSIVPVVDSCEIE